MKKNYKVTELDWDTNFFGVKSCKIDLDNEITLDDIKEINKQINNYSFITIKNKGNNYSNNQIIGEKMNCFLVDINYQFEMPIKFFSELDSNISFINKDIDKEIIPQLEHIAASSFVYSRFFNDHYLEEYRKKIYPVWIVNSVADLDKSVLVYKEDNKVLGFLSFSITDNTGTIELIAIDKKAQGKGIGKRLIQYCSTYCKKRNCNIFKVGTQADNTNAIQFYLKQGFKFTELNSIYHLWSAV